MTADAAYAAPTPEVFYIHDDLSDYVRHTHGEQSVAFQLAQELLMLVRRDPQRVTVLQLEDQITRLVGQGSHAPFAVTVGIGQAGERGTTTAPAHGVVSHDTPGGRHPRGRRPGG